MFTGSRGAQIGQANLRKRILQPAAERVGIEGFTTYDLRHTAISLWLMRGLSPWESPRMVGHTTVGMIEQRYGHLYEHALQAEILTALPQSLLEHALSPSDILDINFSPGLPVCRRPGFIVSGRGCACPTNAPPYSGGSVH